MILARDLDGQILPEPVYLVVAQPTLLPQIALDTAKLTLQHLRQPRTHVARPATADPGRFFPRQGGLAIALVDFLGGLRLRL